MQNLIGNAVNTAVLTGALFSSIRLVWWEWI